MNFELIDLGCDCGTWISILNNMAEERPPTNEEIVDLRARTSAFVSENGEGSNYLLVFTKFERKN